MKLKLLFAVFVLLLFGCQPEPQKVQEEESRASQGHPEHGQGK